MKLTPKASLGIIFLLICIGALAVIFAFQVLTSSVAIALMLFGVFFMTYCAALLLYLQRRDRKRALNAQTKYSAAMPSEDLKGTIYGLKPACKYKVVRSFTDYHGNQFQENETLHFKERHFLPYHGGHTIIFDEKTLYLQEEANKGFIGNFSAYIMEIT